MLQLSCGAFIRLKILLSLQACVDPDGKVG